MFEDGRRAGGACRRSLRLRILHVINTVDPDFGGPVEALRQLVAAVPGEEVEVACLDNAAPRLGWAVPVHALGASVTKYSFSRRLIPWLRQRAERFDAVVAHGVWHYHTVGTWLALRGLSVPYFVVPHGMLNPWFRRTYPLKHLKKALFWHTAVHRALKGARAVIFLCESERALAPGMFRIAPQAEAVAPLGIQGPPEGVSALRDRFIEEHPSLRGKRLVLFLGRLARVKGCDMLLRAFARLAPSERGLHLLMCGPDYEGWQPALTALAAELGIADRVTWTGPLYGEEKWGVLQAADLLVLSSHCETFPIALLEGLSCGLPALITDQVCIHREIYDSGAGLICQPSPESLAAGLGAWCRMDANKRDGYRLRSRAAFLSRFEARAAAAKHLEVIRRFTNVQSGPALVPEGRPSAV